MGLALSVPLREESGGALALLGAALSSRAEFRRAESTGFDSALADDTLRGDFSI
eukprot:CAMPEP_0170400258 /NCGR_PEP_ID=MMETSP0117_2-20130122/24409_1 /TAXON_ID=400756 /ORGANISM="Durinskia baltica, Strain CSIRO CS-38" /LENGTH=53 /DNA_ID=CAMNT_0010657009 /DNA_START=521 /DNA_END=682 /DNA_ORIENTATION=-